MWATVNGHPIIAVYYQGNAVTLADQLDRKALMEQLSARFQATASTFEPNQLAHGMRHVVVNGVVTLREGRLTGSRGGQVLRRNH